MKETWSMIKATVAAWSDDYASSMGAAISYYTLFSIAPLLLIVIAIAGLVLGQEAAQGRIVEELAGFLGEEGATAVQGLIRSASDTGTGVVGTIVSLVTLLIGATTVFAELQSALDRIWRSPAAKRPEGIWGMIRARLLSFGLVLALGFILLVSLVASAVVSALGGALGGLVGAEELMLQVLNFVFSFALISVLFALIYKFLPSVHVAWKDVWIGAVATSALFSIGKFLISFYIGRTGVASGFGAAGSIVVLLVWTYYSAQIFLLGAEFTWVYAQRYASRKGQQGQEKAPAPEVPTRGGSPRLAEER